MQKLANDEISFPWEIALRKRGEKIRKNSIEFWEGKRWRTREIVCEKDYAFPDRSYVYRYTLAGSN